MSTEFLEEHTLSNRGQSRASVQSSIVTVFIKIIEFSLNSLRNQLKNNTDMFIVGDPDSKFLRKVETEVMIPKLIREKAKTEKCSLEVQEFSKCCKDASFSMVYKCRNENSMLKDCMIKWFSNPEFKKICEEQYLKERSEYRRTGVTKKAKMAQNADN